MHSDKGTANAFFFDAATFLGRRTDSTAFPKLAQNSICPAIGSFRDLGA